MVKAAGQNQGIQGNRNTLDGEPSRERKAELALL
jgi:hypothetical protein